MNVSSSIALQIAEPARSYSTLTDIASSTPTQVVSSIQINPIPTLVSILTAAGIIICCLVIAEAIIAAIICYKKKKRQSRRIYPAVHDERHMYDANCIITVLFQLFIITVFFQLFPSLVKLELLDKYMRSLQRMVQWRP